MAEESDKMFEHSNEDPPQALSSSRDRTFAALFVALWLVPILYVGLFQKSVPFEKMLGTIRAPEYFTTEISNFLNNNYRIACLFPDRVKSWSNYYFQVSLDHTGENWISLEEDAYSRMKPFGFRTRLKRMIGWTINSDNGPALQRSMAEYVKARYEELNPKKPEVRSVRVIRIVYKSGEEEIAKPAGHWAIPPLDSIKHKKHWVTFTEEFPVKN